MNIANCGFEWLTAPLMLFCHTDRLFFLINVVSYALLPGLVFSVFKRLQVHGRVSWWWMWLLPAGCCYVFQAGTPANDIFASVYALAAVDLALRAYEKKSVGDLWLSMLAAALLTGSKQTSIPLALLWLIAALPAWRLLRVRPGISMVVIVVSLLVSALPMMCLNYLHDCTWLGIPKHPGLDWTAMLWQKGHLHSPFWGVVGNAFCLPLQNFTPPFFPLYATWNELMMKFTQAPAGSHFAEFESFGMLQSFPGQQSGIGLFLCLFLMVSVFWVWQRRGKDAWNYTFKGSNNRTAQLLRWTPWLLLLLFMAKIGTYQNARQLAPYYAFFLPCILVQPGHWHLVRRLWWKKLGLSVMLGTAALVVLSPIFPLWPACTVLAASERHYPDSKIILRIRSFYSASEISRGQRQPFYETLPPNEQVVGYATSVQGLEPGLWRPFYRRVERILSADTRRFLQQRGIRYVVVEEQFLSHANCTLGELLQRYDARLIDRLALSRGFNSKPQYVYLIELNSNPSDH